MSNWFADRRVRAAALVIGSVLALLIVFFIGILIGASALRPLGLPFLEQLLHFQRGYGAVGTVTRIQGNTIAMIDRDGQTRTIAVTSSTRIQLGQRRHGALSDIHLGDTILVIGSPGQNAIQARFIRVMNTAPGTPQGTPAPLLLPNEHYVLHSA